MNTSIRRKVMWAGCKLAQGEIVINSRLPWREQRTPYRVFLAEMLLVRTRVDVVTRSYKDVFQHYSDIYQLAKANEEDIREVLYPLGLSKRVLYIHRAAKYICEKHNGEIPGDVDNLLKIPGIGLYTAVAVAAFAYGISLVPGDVNILRFISRLTGLEMENKTKGSVLLKELLPLLSESLTGLPAERLLDFTRLVSHSRQPLCQQCPLTRHCTFFQEVM